MRKNKTARRTPHGASWHPVGELHPMAILTADKVRSIRHQLLAGVSRVVLAQTYGVTSRTIRAVQERQTWAHVQ